MTRRDEGRLVFGAIAAITVVSFFATMPSDDQVCRARKTMLFDWLHGTDAQPTCQQLIKQIERHGVDTELRARQLTDDVYDLEQRLTAVESRLNL